MSLQLIQEVCPGLCWFWSIYIQSNWEHTIVPIQWTSCQTNPTKLWCLPLSSSMYTFDVSFKNSWVYGSASGSLSLEESLLSRSPLGSLSLGPLWSSSPGSTSRWSGIKLEAFGMPSSFSVVATGGGWAYVGISSTSFYSTYDSNCLTWIIILGVNFLEFIFSLILCVEACGEVGVNVLVWMGVVVLVCGGVG